MSSSKKVTITDIAKEVQVSKSVVSNYLNKRFNTMSEETREKIRIAIDELGYKPNENYRNYRKAKTGVIGLIVPDITDSFYANLSKGIFDGGFERGYNVIMSNTDNNIVREKAYINSFENKIDGLIISTVDYEGEHIKELKKKFPIVLSDRKINSNEFDLVTSNNEQIMFDLLEYFKAKGFESFILFTEELREGTARTVRGEAFNKFVKENDFSNDSKLIEVNVHNDTLLIKEFLSVRSRRKKKMVVIGVNGRVLLKLLSIANNLNIELDEDFQISGYDDFDEAPSYRPSITTIKQPIYEMGYKLAIRLIDRINNESLEVKEFKIRAKLSIKD